MNPLALTVARTGIGIHLQKDERMFVEFKRVDFSYSRHQQGRAAGSNPFARSNPTNDSLTLNAENVPTRTIDVNGTEPRSSES